MSTSLVYIALDLRPLFLIPFKIGRVPSIPIEVLWKFQRNTSSALRSGGNFFFGLASRHFFLNVVKVLEQLVNVQVLSPANPFFLQNFIRLH